MINDTILRAIFKIGTGFGQGLLLCGIAIYLYLLVREVESIRKFYEWPFLIVHAESIFRIAVMFAFFKILGGRNGNS